MRKHCQLIAAPPPPTPELPFPAPGTYLQPWIEPDTELAIVLSKNAVKDRVILMKAGLETGATFLGGGYISPWIEEKQDVSRLISPRKTGHSIGHGVAYILENDDIDPTTGKDRNYKMEDDSLFN